MMRKLIPFSATKKKLVEQVLKHEKTFLGLCLGGQMLARVMGAQVRKHEECEIGWHQIQIENARLGLLSRPKFQELFFFQWHQDTFDLPIGAVEFAKNHITQNQGFIAGNGSAIATQFHPEADEAWVRYCAADDELPQGKFVQSPEEMVLGLKYLPKQSAWFADVMSHLAARTKIQSQLASLPKISSSLVEEA